MPKALIAVLVAGLNIGVATATPIPCNLQSESESYAAYLERQRGTLATREQNWVRAGDYATIGARKAFVNGMAKSRAAMAVNAERYQLKMKHAARSGDWSTACNALSRYKRAMDEVVNLRQRQLKTLPNTFLHD